MKITLDEWREGHLLGLNCASDVYYVKLANSMREYLSFADLSQDINDYEQCAVAKLVAYYFEDVISDVGLWHTFVTKHKELYGKYLPFYEIDESQYYTDEINLEDIRFLVWMGVQQFHEDIFVNPENPAVMDLAQMWYELLDGEFEKAPINTRLVEHMYSSKWFKNFFILKDWCTQLYTTMYLLQSSLEESHIVNETDHISKALKCNEEMGSYAAYSFLCFLSKVGPLALTMPEWLSCMLKHKGMEREAELLVNMKILPYNFYLLKDYNQNQLTIENMEGEIYTVERSSFSDMSDKVLTCYTLLCSLVLYGDSNWQVNGASSCFETKDFFMKIREKSMEKKANERALYERLMKTHKNYRLLYFADYEEMTQWMEERVGFFPNFAHLEKMKEYRNIALFIQSNGQFSIIRDAALLIKDDRNPCYSPAAANEEAHTLILVPYMITNEMLHYLLEHNLLPDACTNSLHGPEHGRLLVQENMDFLARMFRRYMY